MSGCARVNAVERLPVGRGDLLVPQPHRHDGLAAVGFGRSSPAAPPSHANSTATSASAPAHQRGEPGPRVTSSPETTIDATMWRWNATNSAISGTIATVVAAITNVHWALYRDCRSAVATVSTRHLCAAGDHQRPHEVVPLRDHGDQRQGHQDRPAGRDHDVHDHVQGVGAVEAGGVDQVVRDHAKVLAQQEDRVRRAEHERQHQRPERVAQAELGHHQIQRHHRDRRRAPSASRCRPRTARRARETATARTRTPASTENVSWPTRITAVISAVTATARPKPASGQVGVVGQRRRPRQLQRRARGELVRRRERGQQAKRERHQRDQRAQRQARRRSTVLTRRLGEVIADPPPEVEVLNDGDADQDDEQHHRHDRRPADRRRRRRPRRRCGGPPGRCCRAGPPPVSA